MNVTPTYPRHRAGLNEREVPGKVVTARPPKRSAQMLSASHALVSTLQKHRSKTSKLIRYGNLHFRGWLYTKRSNQTAPQFWRVANSLKTWKTSKGVFWYSSARPPNARDQSSPAKTLYFFRVNLCLLVSQLDFSSLTTNRMKLWKRNRCVYFFLNTRWFVNKEYYILQPECLFYAVYEESISKTNIFSHTTKGIFSCAAMNQGINTSKILVFAGIGIIPKPG